MRFFLLLAIILMFPIAAMANTHQDASSAANPATSQELESLNAQRAKLQSEHNILIGKQDFWHGWTIGLGVIAAIIGIFAGGAALMESTRVGSQRDTDAKLEAVDGKITDWKRMDSDWRIENANLKRIALENRILDTFGPRTMTPVQSAGMIRKLLGLTGVQVDVLVVDFISAPNSAEFKDSVSIGRSIRDTLNAANLDAEGWIVNSCAEGTGAQGLSVAVHFGAATMDEYFAGKILAAFPPALRFVDKVENFEPTSFCKKFSALLPTGRPNKRKPGTAKIMIVIGAKTQPLLTREMLEPDDSAVN